MFRFLGISLLLGFAGCAMQSADRSPAADLAGTTPSAPVAVERAPCPPRGSLAPRIGLEFFPAEPSGRLARLTGLATLRRERLLPKGGEPDTPPRDPIAVEPLHHGTPAANRTERRAARETDLPWNLSRDELWSIDNPVERLTLQFLHRVLGEDHRRVQRSISAPILFHQARHVSQGVTLRTQLDERDAEDHQLLLAREGRRLLNRPLRKALRDASVIHDLDIAFDDFKARNLPFSRAADDLHDDDVDWGRISLRVRVTRPSDPAEVTYVRGSWRVGTGRERFKTGYMVDLAPDISVGIRTNYLYGADQLHVWGDLHWRLGPDARLHVLAGDSIDLLTGSTLYPLVHSPVVLHSADESPGMMFYVEHMF